ncbi:flagellar biosynthesis anti-sigma factor FlgM [Photobacterium proteolyticum]|uniref:Negative regulator of flagellin synthesis n=1 Tax=Photobacterium proteolyticum TaxID=1903952 RepID=A0A1Q9GVC3_9GAMM|nr:flagellar biosynthesis anti-sigma factor FlgM [Photobacterium proteolyticum]OLQ79117.1 flagellar biosynthesis anti-sigma factor FlgM [Photobacterium proteolyticum]
MKIDKVIGTHVQPNQLGKPESKTLQLSSATQTAEPQVSIDTQLLSKAQDSFNQLPDVDMAKVESVKQALARGELDLDISALSSALMRFHTGHE